MNMEDFKRWAVRLLAVFGFIVVLAIGMWGSVQVVRGGGNVFSALANAFVSLTSVFVPAGEKVELTTPSTTIAAGDTFTLSWAHDKKSLEGSYTFRYDCADGVYFTSPDVSGKQVMIYCNTPFNFLNASNGMQLTASSSNNRYADVTLYIEFTPNGQSRPTVTGERSVTIQNNGIATSPGTINNGTSTTGTNGTTGTTPRTPGQQSTDTRLITGGQASNPNGYVDLLPKIIELGVVDKNTGAFTASSTPNANQRVGVRFQVTNQGTKTSPQWDFSAVLPTLPSYIYSSNMQQALGPGDRIEFTIGFDSFDTSTGTTTGTFVVNVDPSNRFNEPNKTNNILRYIITVIK